MRIALASLALLVVVGCRPLDAGAPIDDDLAGTGGAAARQAAQIGNLRIIDGDTFEADGETIRIANIDTPEMPPRSKCMAEARLAEIAKAELDDVLGGTWGVLPVIERDGEDRYGRTLARVTVAGKDVGEELVRRGVAVQWSGRRAEWCTIG